MKQFKFSLILVVLILLSALQLFAIDTNAFIKGTLDIKYNSRLSETPAKGVKDIYTLDVNVANTAKFHGTITDTPLIVEGLFSKSVTQPRSLYYDIACDVVNPKNPTQTRNVGRLYGKVPIGSSLSTENGVYQYDRGNLTVDILPIGKMQGFSSKFTGTAIGKPMGRPSNWLDTLQCSTVNIIRTVNGKTTTVSLKKYDKMEFRNQILGAGPLPNFTPVTAQGEMLYDYDKSCWFFNNFTMQYADVSGSVKIDRVTGTIRWDEKAGEYTFDVRINEPLVTAAGAFESTPAVDASAFFETDTSLSALTGSMTYKDSKSGDKTLASRVAIDLTGNKMSLEQTMALGKIIIFSAVVPMNAD
jgi:hypothetical protein